MLTVNSTINLAGQAVPNIIPAVQGDTGRVIVFTLADFTIPAGSTATYYVQKPSGEAVYNSATINDNKVTVELTAQSLAETGDNYGQVRILNGEDVVTSFDFILLVKPFRGIGAIESSTEMNIFDEAVQNAMEQFDSMLPDIIAPEFDSSTAYTAGDYVIYSGKLYQFTTAHAGAWTGADANAKKIGGELSALKEDSNVQTEILKLKRSIPISFTVEGTRYINASTGGLGASSTGSSFSHTDYIDIGSFTLLSYKKVYTTSSNPALGMAFYDASKVYISGEKAKGSGSGLGYVDGFIDVPENAKYARFTTINDTTSYGEFSIYAINPLDDEYDKKSSLYNNLWNYGEVVHGHSIDPRNGNLTDNNDYDVTDYIPVQEGNIIYGYGARFYCYDSDKNIVSGETGVLNSLATTLANGMKYYIIPSGASYFRICAQRTLEIYQFRLYLASPLEHIQESQTQRTIYTLGDSITRGMYAEIGTSSSSGPSPKGYPYWIGQANGYTVVNLGNSGSGWANVGSPESQDDPSTAYNAKGVVDNHTFDDADIITLAFGVNDWKGAAQNIALGDMTSTPGDGTVIGNMKYCIETLADPVNGKAKNAQIVVLLPLNTNRQWPGMDTMTLENNWAFGYAYRNNQTLDDYRTAIRECAEYYNLKVIDLEEVCPINRLNIRNVCGDGLHPTLAFHKQIGLALAPLIC